MPLLFSKANKESAFPRAEICAILERKESNMFEIKEE